MSNKTIGWESWETIGIGIPNPRSCVHVTPPENMNKEQKAQWEKFVEALEKELEQQP